MHPVLNYLLEQHDQDWRSEYDDVLKATHFYQPLIAECSPTGEFGFYLSENNQMFMSSLPEALEDEVESFLETLSLTNS